MYYYRGVTAGELHMREHPVQLGDQHLTQKCIGTKVTPVHQPVYILVCIGN